MLVCSSQCRLLAHPSRGHCREGRPVTARKRTLALSRSLSARARARIAELNQEIDRLQRTEDAIVVAPVRHASADARRGSCWVSRLWRWAASVLRDAGVAICWRGTAAGMHGRDCDRLADI